MQQFTNLLNPKIQNVKTEKDIYKDVGHTS